MTLTAAQRTSAERRAVFPACRPRLAKRGVLPPSPFPPVPAIC